MNLEESVRPASEPDGGSSEVVLQTHFGRATIDRTGGHATVVDFGVAECVGQVVHAKGCSQVFADGVAGKSIDHGVGRQSGFVRCALCIFRAAGTHNRCAHGECTGGVGGAQLVHDFGLAVRGPDRKCRQALKQLPVGQLNFDLN